VTRKAEILLSLLLAVAIGNTAASQAGPGVLYRGVDSRGIAWLVYLPSSGTEGVQYHALKNEAVCDFRRDSAGQVSWSSPTGRVVARFEGAPRPGGLRGVVNWVEVATGRVTRSFDLDLDSMALPTLSADTAAEVYSNVGYNERAGDLTGAEILVLRTGRDSVVWITLFEGVSRPPVPMTDLQWIGDTLAGSYGTPRSYRIKFVRAPNALVDRWGTVLKRQVGLRRQLLDKPRFACGTAR
jgi:hypothetical protein